MMDIYGDSVHVLSGGTPANRMQLALVHGYGRGDVITRTRGDAIMTR